ncbi:MAG: cold shock and DUF1294 domain-containing protein [Candidatus Dactylopiibacterium sp.]|nr:cold shock and DUF1294 domain-containing protein [Candidatus Dactylopiibacterium sp.]
MRISGKLTTWKDDQGYGFITPEGGGEPVFFHIKSLHPDATRPVAGEALSFEPGTDARGRPQALKVRRAGETLPDPRRGHGPKAPAFAIAFGVLMAGAVLAGRLPQGVAAYYLLLSLAAYGAYWFDKKKAENGMRRTPEANLHLVALAGGWPGALAAQRRHRHKTVKPTFQRTFWITVALNCLALGWLLTSAQGQHLLKSAGL